MYAQLIESRTTPARRAELDRVVTGQVIPALKQELGFGSTLHLVDRATGDGLIIVLWESAEQAARPLHEYGPDFIEALERFASISTGRQQPPSVWEVDVRV